METKSIWKSKTFWINVISALLEVAQLLTGTQILPPSTLTLIMNVLNILLRRITSTSVTFGVTKK